MDDTKFAYDFTDDYNYVSDREDIKVLASDFGISQETADKITAVYITGIEGELTELWYTADAEPYLSDTVFFDSRYYK